MEIKFKRDTSFRKSLFVPDSFAHPAKMDAQLLIWLVWKYTKVGDVILDPMAGSGTLMLACTLGRDCILVELEEKFCKMMRDNWEKVRQRPQLGFQMGDCQIIQGDARNLDYYIHPYRYGSEIRDGEFGPKWHYPADAIIISPPFGEQGAKGFTQEQIRQAEIKHKRTYTKASWASAVDYSKDPFNIGNLSYGDIDAVITSPPYEASVTGKDGIDWSKGTRGEAEGNKPRDKSREPAFEHSAIGGVGFRYSADKNNIGNLKSQSYLEAMLQVYQQCYAILRKGGLLILVTKNFIRNKQVVRLDTDTVKLCEQAGFKFIERHHRKLPAQSFWRVLYHKKFPEVEQINHEDILVFRS